MMFSSKKEYSNIWWIFFKLRNIVFSFYVNWRDFYLRMRYWFNLIWRYLDNTRTDTKFYHFDLWFSNLLFLRRRVLKYVELNLREIFLFIQNNTLLLFLLIIIGSKDFFFQAKMRRGGEAIKIITFERGVFFFKLCFFPSNFWYFFLFLSF